MDKTTNRSILRPGATNLSLFIKLRTAAGGVRIAKIVGYRTLTSRRDGSKRIARVNDCIGTIQDVARSAEFVTDELP